MITGKVDLSYFNRRTKEFARGVTFDWAFLVKDTSRLAIEDQSRRSAAGKHKGRAQSKKSRESIVKRDIKRSARKLGINGWTDKRISDLIQNRDWVKLELKFHHMNTNSRNIRKINERGLQVFNPHMHRRARDKFNHVPDNYPQQQILIPTDESVFQYGNKKKTDVGVLRAGFYGAGQYLKAAKSAFPEYVKRHGKRSGTFRDLTKGFGHEISFTWTNRAGGAGNPWFKKSFDWWFVNRIKMQRRKVKSVLAQTHADFNAGRPLAMVRHQRSPS